MREIRALADRVTVLRDGRHIRTLDAATATDGELVELMTAGASTSSSRRSRTSPARWRSTSRTSLDRDGTVAGVNFHARAGEITGIAGLVGCGKSELVRAVYGLEPFAGGTVRLHGTPYDHPTPRGTLRRGAAYFPANRVAEGLALTRPIREKRLVDGARPAALRARRPAARKGRARHRRPDHGAPEAPTGGHRARSGNLSGGNRQKVMLGRALTRDLTVFLFDEPSVGIDVGAKLESTTS